MLFDELCKLFIFGLEITLRFVFFIGKRKRLAVSVWFFIV